MDFITTRGNLVDRNGDPLEEVIELWRKDPIECVRELIGNPAYQNNRYAPIKVYEDAEGRTRVYSDMCTGDLWWELQVSNQH